MFGAPFDTSRAARVRDDVVKGAFVRGETR